MGIAYLPSVEKVPPFVKASGANVVPPPPYKVRALSSSKYDDICEGPRQTCLGSIFNTLDEDSLTPGLRLEPQKSWINGRVVQRESDARL